MIEVDLKGPDGNAYVLMGLATNLCKQLEKDPKPILERMRSGNYQNLLKVFDGEFGEYVKLLGWKKEDEEDLEGSISESSSEKEKRK